MTDWGAERVERTACRSAVVPHGGSPLMPSHSQGAERRPERRAERTGSRWLLRALVVGGLAGVAWLLTGPAAQASDASAATAAGNEPAVGELLEAATQSPEVAPENHAVTSIPVVREVAPSPRASGGTVDAVAKTARTTGTVSRKRQVNRLIPAARPAPETLHRDLPGDEVPAPRRMYPGAVNGIPAHVPGASPEFGPLAVLPARVARGAVDDHRLPVAADVEARRNDAVAPTVSPD